ncbi:unnamed protein product [Caenorhabditis nigoni]
MFRFVCWISVLLIFTSTSASKLFPPGISTISDDCSSKESMISIGICSRYVHQLAEYNEDIYLGYPLSMDALANVTKLCASIESDMDIRKSAFEGKGKECFLSITNHSCRPESKEYLKNSYDKLVDYLTIDNDGPDQCNSLYDELNSYQCIAYRYVVSGFLGELGSARLMRKPFENNETEPMLEEARVKLLPEMLQVHRQRLSIPGQLSKDMVNYKSDYPVVMKVLSHFDSCFEDTLKYTDVDNYDCVRKLPQKSGTSHESAPNVKLSLRDKKCMWFLRDKKCMKLIMMRECHMSSKIFEEGWETTRNQMKTLWKELNNE